MKTWFTCKALAKDEAEISIYDEIGLWGVTAKDFIDELKALGPVKSIVLSINSPGGSVFDGVAIYNALKRHPALITVRIEGVAASMAGAVAMAGDHIIMPGNAMFMLHDPMGIVAGNSHEMKQYAELLDKLKNGLVAAYANKSGLDREEVEEMMAEETWLTAEEAHEKGFADAVEDPIQMAASFDLSKFRNAPADAGRKRGPAASTAVQKENPMTDSIDPAIEPETAGTEVAPVETVAEPAAEEPKAQETVTLAVAVEPAGDIAARVRQEARDIMAACKLAGKIDKADGFIAEGKSLSDVVAALQADRPATEEISARHNPKPDQPASWAKSVEKVNARVK